MVIWLSKSQVVRLLDSTALTAVWLEDNEPAYFGNDKDARIVYDGTDLLIRNDTGAGDKVFQTATTEIGRITTDGGWIVGDATALGTAYLQLPSLTTTERNALTPINGMIIYNETTTQLEGYQASAWGAMGGFTWNTALTYSGTNPGIIYGGDTTTDDLHLFANDVDAKPYITLDGLSNIYIYSNLDIISTLGNNTTSIWYLKDLAGNNIITAQANKDISLYGPVTYKGSNPCYFYGGDTTGDDLYLYANNTDAKSYIVLYGDSSIYCYSASDFQIYLGDAVGVKEFVIKDSANAKRFFVDSDGNVTQSGNLELTGGGSITTTANSDLTFLPNGTGITQVGDAGSTSHGLTANDDLFVSGKLEVDGVSFFDALTTHVSHLVINDTYSLLLGSGYDAGIGYNTVQTPDSLMLRTSNDSNGLIICNIDDYSYDFAHALQTNPTVYIQSANQSATEWLSLTHDQTNGVVNVGTGNLSTNNLMLADGLGMTIQTLGNLGATESIQFDDGAFVTGTLNQNCTITLSDPAVTGRSYVVHLQLTQDVTGGWVVTWAGNVIWPGSTEPVLSIGAGDIDYVSFVWNGSKWCLVNAVFDLLA